MKRYFSACLFLCLGVINIMAQYNRINDIQYTTSENAYAKERCKLDVYYPTEMHDVPVVVWFHGGGIEAGNKHIDSELLESGYMVVAVNYRLLPKASIDEVLDDAAAAVAWTFNNAEKYNGSRQKIFVAGHSAGGYLLDMIGLNKSYLAKYAIDADSIAGLFPFSGQVITHYNIRKQQNIGPLQPTIDQYAPLTFVRKDAPPIIIISGDRELELYGRYEEQAYFWRMLKLTGHPDVSLYEMQGYNHGDMPHPAYHVMKDHIKRLVNSSEQTNVQASYNLITTESTVRNGATVEKKGADVILNLGDTDGYCDLTTKVGEIVKGLHDFTFMVDYNVSSSNKLDGYGHFVFACSALKENSADNGPYVAFRLNEQRFEISTGGYMHEEFIMQGGKPKRNKWIHAVYRQKGHVGELYLDGKLVGRNDKMPYLADIFKAAPENCWVGRAPFKGDKYLSNTQISNLRILNYAVDDKDIK